MRGGSTSHRRDGLPRKLFRRLRLRALMIERSPLRRLPRLERSPLRRLPLVLGRVETLGTPAQAVPQTSSAGTHCKRTSKDAEGRSPDVELHSDRIRRPSAGLSLTGDSCPSGVRLQRVPADGGNAGVCGTACARSRIPNQTSTTAAASRERTYIGFSPTVSSYTWSSFVLSKMSSWRDRPVTS
ncbi:MAG: hypothetical protein RIT24_3206 [Planctomycetota bacterium]